MRVLTKYGDRPTFKVTDVTETALIGRDQDTALDVSIEPVSGMLIGMLDGLVASKAIKAYREAATAAGLRMEQMLVYKDENNCPSGPTGDLDMTDSTVLTRLQDLELQLREQDIGSRKYLAARRKLLDGLR